MHDENGMQSEVDNVRNYFNVNKKAFYIALAIFLVLLAITIFSLYKAIQGRNAKIEMYSTQMAKRDVDVKLRDAEVDSLDKLWKSQDIFLAEARDSIATAYAQIANYQNQQILNHAKHKADSLAINHLNLSDKIKFLSGQH